MIRRLWALPSRSPVATTAIGAVTIIASWLVLTSFSTSIAQVYAPSTLNQQVNAQVDVLALAQQKVQNARQKTSGIQATVDHPAWKDALVHIDTVYRANPTDINVLYFATVVYNEVGWDYQVWEFGREYLEAGGVFDEVLVQILTSVGNDLGYSYYQAGNTEFAIAYFEAVSQINPQDAASVQEIGSIYSEAGFAEEAAAYWQEAMLRGSLEAQHLWEQAVLEQQIGPDATFAYYHGIEHYEEGSIVEATDAFSIAVALSPTFTESWRWLARTLMETCVSQDALWAWQNYAELAPYDKTTAYFIDIVNEQLTWGCEAGQAYMDGLSLYESNLLEDANLYFVYASSLDENYLDAHIWAARSYQELGDANAALFYWYEAQKLAPTDATIDHFIDLLESGSSPLSGAITN